MRVRKRKFLPVKTMKTKLCLFLMTPVLLTGINSAVAQPTLVIVPTNNQALLFWTANAGGTNGVLQSTTNLASPNWVPATDTLAVTYGLQAAVSVTNSSAVRFFRLSLVPPTSDGMALIPAGSFTMGDTLDGDNGDNDAIPTNVYVSSFYMDTNLVSYTLWTNEYQWATNHGYAFYQNTVYVPYVAGGKGANHPVQTVDWYDCVKWCNARSEQAGLTPVYYTDGTQATVYRTGELDLTNGCVNWAASGYRLPTEAELEKAARGGLSGQRFPWGDTISESQANYYACANCGDNYDLGPYNGYNTNFDTGGYPYTSPVGSFASNGYGLYDMAGNVQAWCWDWYAGPPYPAGSPYLGGSNPTGAGPGLGFRVSRGGGWDWAAFHAQCADRDTYDPDDTENVFGVSVCEGVLDSVLLFAQHWRSLHRLRLCFSYRAAATRVEKSKEPGTERLLESAEAVGPRATSRVTPEGLTTREGLNLAGRTRPSVVLFPVR